MKITVGTTGIAWSISEALPIRKTYTTTIRSSQEAMTSMFRKGRGSSHLIKYQIPLFMPLLMSSMRLWNMVPVIIKYPILFLLNEIMKRKI